MRTNLIVLLSPSFHKDLGFIREGQHVLLMLGSCGKCKTPKGNILHTILNQKEKLVSHLVVDSRTAGELVEIMKREEE